MVWLLRFCGTGTFHKLLASNFEGNLKYLSLNNRPCQARPTLLDISSNKTLFYPFTVSVNNCSESCNSTDDPYVRICVTNIVKHMNVKVFNLISGINETRSLVQHELCKIICTLNQILSNSNKKWNHGGCRCDCKDDWSSCKDDYMSNPITCDCQWTKACKNDKNLGIKNYSCIKRLFDILVLASEGELLSKTETLLDNKKVTC